MADLGFVFNASEVEARQGFDLLPPGEYIGEITESDFLVTKKGNGQYIKLVFTILDGPFAGRKYFDNINIKHENKVAMDIAQGTLKELLTACGLEHKPFSQTHTLHGIPVKMKIGMSKRKDTGEDQNTVRYKNLKDSGSRAPAASPSTPAAYTAPSDAPKKKPWEK